MILDAEKIYAKLVVAGEDWADKNSAADLLEETKSSALAEIMTGLGSDMSVAARESLAKCNPQYREHIAAMVEARRVANRARVIYDSLKMLAELRRSIAATRRAEMTLV